MLSFEAENIVFQPQSVQWTSEIVDDWKIGKIVKACNEESAISHNSITYASLVTVQTASELYSGWVPSLSISLLGHPAPPPQPPPHSPPTAPPLCTNGRIYRNLVGAVELTCDFPIPNSSQQLVSRCACRGDELFDASVTGVCLIAHDCPAAEPAPPPPPTPLPPPPIPPLFPRAIHALTPTCTSNQELQNKNYCYDRLFSQLVCQYDAGVHCPERCRRCTRAFPNLLESYVVQIVFSIDSAIEDFDTDTFNVRLADTLGVSAAPIVTLLRIGSIFAETTIPTMAGTYDAASTLAQSASAAFADQTSTSTKLEVGVLSTPEIRIVAPRSSSSSPSPSPSSPPLSPSPSPQPPPSLPHSPHSPSPHSPSGGSSGFSPTATIIGICVAALVILIVLIAFLNQRNKGKTQSRDEKFLDKSYAPVVIYASSSI